MPGWDVWLGAHSTPFMPYYIIITMTPHLKLCVWVLEGKLISLFVRVLQYIFFLYFGIRTREPSSVSHAYRHTLDE